MTGNVWDLKNVMFLWAFSSSGMGTVVKKSKVWRLLCASVYLSVSGVFQLGQQVSFADIDAEFGSVLQITS